MTIIMLGAIVNAAAIVGFSMIGLGLSKLLGKMDLERFQTIVMKAIGLAVLYIGISGTLENKRILVLIFSMVIGAVLGELINIDKGMNKLGSWMEKKTGYGDGNFAKGFVAASILYCTGSMAIVGAMESGLTGNHEMLFAKAIIDGITAIVFSYEMGVGVMFAAIPVLLYEGAITLGATFAQGWFTAEIITEMSAAGSLLIAAIGLNLLGVKEIKVANLIPAIFIPWAIIGLESLFF